MKVKLLFGSDNMKSPIISGDLAAKTKWYSFKSAPSFRDLGSKEETFYDSQAWLDSDCDDDFMSDNGELLSVTRLSKSPKHKGGCISNHQTPSVMNIQVLFVSDDMNIVKPHVINGDLAAKPKPKCSSFKSAPSFQDIGSKEETFYDSQACLDSDCDDDFMSDNGELSSVTRLSNSAEHMGGGISNHQKTSAMREPKWYSFKSAPSFRDLGTKEETFFDSQAWLDSDCDDDFTSVNGGNKKPPVAVSTYQPSRNGQEKKTQLSNLFNDNLRTMVMKMKKMVKP